MIKCAIIDDESRHREFLRELLTIHFPDVKIEGEANSVPDGVVLLNRIAVDLIFLDVQMHPYTGFDLLQMLPGKNFGIIFTTSYDTYAIEAIRFSAIDYLLKPFGYSDLKNALERCYEKIGIAQHAASVATLFHNLHTENKKRMAIADKNGIAFFDLAQIIYCKSENVYTTFYFEAHPEVVSSKPIIEYEKELEPHGFYRIHNSTLVNVSKIKKYIRGEGGQVIMSNNAVLDVARARKASLMQRLQL